MDGRDTDAIYFLRIFCRTILLEGVFLFMAYIKEESFILEEMEKMFKNLNTFNYQLYYECQKVCTMYGMEQIYHAKAVLEEKKIYHSEINNANSYLLTFFSIVVAVIALWFSILPDKIMETLNMDPLFLIGIFAVIVVAIIYELHDKTVISYRKTTYFYSIICDEIEKRMNNVSSK